MTTSEAVILPIGLGSATTLLDPAIAGAFFRLSMFAGRRRRESVQSFREPRDALAVNRADFCDGVGVSLQCTLGIGLLESSSVFEQHVG